MMLLALLMPMHAPLVSFDQNMIELAELFSKQNIWVVDRQAFIFYCELRQFWEQT